MRNRLGRMEAFDALLENLLTEAVSSEATPPAASDRRPEDLYADARIARDMPMAREGANLATPRNGS